MHQTQIAFLDQIQQRKAGGLVLLGDRHHQSQVGLHEGTFGVAALPGRAAQLALARGRHVNIGFQLLGSLFALLNGLGQANFVLFGQQGILTDVCEVQPDEVLFVPLDALLSQRNPTSRLSTEPAAPSRHYWAFSEGSQPIAMLCCRSLN